MPLDLCLEAAGGLVQAIDLVWFDRRLPKSDFEVANPSGDRSESQIDLEHPSFTSMVQGAADRLPIDEATTVWLVDVCGLGYADAGVEMGVDRADVARTIGRARDRIRTDLPRLPTI